MCSAELSDTTGLNLLQIAFNESQGAVHQDQGFSRQLYIDALSYLLRGLPPDLSQQEVYSLRRALPAQIDKASIENTPLRDKASPSLLHRGLASSVILLCLLVRLLSPYIKYIVATAYRYERTHHITEKIFTSSISTADSLGKKGIELASSALGHEVVMEGLAYCVDGIRGGLVEGLGEGLKLIEAPRKH